MDLNIIFICYAERVVAPSTYLLAATMRYIAKGVGTYKLSSRGLWKMPCIQLYTTYANMMVPFSF